MNYEILETEPLNLDQVKEELEKIQKRDKELNFRAQKTNEYVQNITELGLKKTEELKKKIEALKISRLKDIHIKKLSDILPVKEDEVKVTLQGYNLTITKENSKKIADVIKEFV